MPALYSPGSRVTSRLDLRDNRKVITDYRNHGIDRILIDLVVSSRYLPSVLRDVPSSTVLHKASSHGLGHPWGRSPCGLPWVSRVVPPTGDHVDEDSESHWRESSQDLRHLWCLCSIFSLKGVSRRLYSKK